MAYFDRYGVEHPGKKPRVDHVYRVMHWDVHDENGKRNSYAVLATVFNKVEAVKLAKQFVASHPGADVEVYDTTSHQSIYGRTNPRRGGKMSKYKVTVVVSAKSAQDAKKLVQRMNKSKKPSKHKNPIDDPQALLNMIDKLERLQSQRSSMTYRMQELGTARRYMEWDQVKEAREDVQKAISELLWKLKRTGLLQYRSIGDLRAFLIEELNER